MILSDTTEITYSVEYDSETREWIATADDEIRSFDCSALAYLWASQQILADE